jgi:hypothetical protein
MSIASDLLCTKFQKGELRTDAILHAMRCATYEGLCDECVSIKSARGIDGLRALRNFEALASRIGAQAPVKLHSIADALLLARRTSEISSKISVMLSIRRACHPGPAFCYD